jgi:sugar phosphate isomerase/epimerase
MLRLSMLTLAVVAVVAWFPVHASMAQEQKTEKPAKPKRAARAGKAARGPQWHLSMQAYTFHKASFFEAIDRTKALGIKYIEAFPGQTLSKEEPNVKFDQNISPEVMAEVQKKLNDAGITLVNYGVVDLGKDEVSARKVFEFAKKMGIKTIVSEPQKGMFDTLDKLTKEYKIKVAIHNHPKPSPYWNPDFVLEAIKGHGKMIGSCADTGHWPRSGVNPLEALKKLDGHIISLHFKDLNALTKKDAEGDLHDVPWGTGKCDAKAMLEELKRQKFSGVFSIEYEWNWEHAMPEIEKCVTWFHATAKDLGVKND